MHRMLVLLALGLLVSLQAKALRVTGADVPGENVPGDNALPGTLPLDEIKKKLDAPGAHDAFLPKIHEGLLADLAEKIPKDNPCTPAKVELGRQLYFDPRLSREGTISCASCHNPTKGWTDGEAVSTGMTKKKGDRSAPSIVNRVLAPVQFWDGRAASLEEQALGPIGNPIEMVFSPDEAAKRVNEIPGYRVQFEKIFGGEATPEKIAKAIAAFERTVVSGGAPDDYFVLAEPFRGGPASDDTAEDLKRRDEILAAEKAHPMGEAALRGRKLFFEKAQCSLCHAGRNYSDEQFHNIGIGLSAKGPDAGREKHTKQEKDRFAFRTPGLRNIKDTAPYMHDGSLKTLREVVEHYNKGGVPNKWLSDKIRKLNLTDAEIDDLVAFLEKGLQGPVTKVDVPRLP